MRKEKKERYLPSWRDYHLWVMEGWFRVDDKRECYGLVFDGADTEEVMELDWI